MRIEFHQAGLNELLTSSAAKSLLHEQADAMLERANAVPSTTDPANAEPYYEVEDGSDGKRARLRIHPTSARAAKHEAKTQALQKALGG